MSKLDWLVLAACLGLTAPILSFVYPLTTRTESAFQAFSAHKRLALVAIGLATITSRAALLPWMPVPEPKVHDEFSYLLAADTFAHLRLANPPHPMWKFIDTFHVIQHPTYASMYPPAQGMVLAVGQWLGHPWIGVLLSVAVMCMAFTWMLQGWVSPAWALIGGILVWTRIGIFSYWMNSYWGGAPGATGAALVLGAVARLRERDSSTNALILALGAGILATSRPLEGAIFFLPVAVFLMWWALRCKDIARRTQIWKRVLVPAGALLACFAAFIGYYNWRLTGSAFLFPHFIEGRMITSALFIWQHDKPPLVYNNPQFDDFYHTFLPGLYQASWPAAVGQWWYKAGDFWEFFLGPALSIPFLALPWVLRDRRSRLLILQLVLCALGLWVVVYYHPHYAGPLMATVWVLLMLSMRRLYRFRALGRAIGRDIVLLIVAFSALIGPAYLITTELSHWHSTLPVKRYGALLLGGTLIVLLVRYASRAGTGSPAPRWSQWAALGVWIVIIFQVCAIEHRQAYDDYPYVDDLNEPFRLPVQRELSAMPGQQLVIVRYSKTHNSGEEYVYNRADIDRAKVVWAREIPGVDLTPLLNYFHGRNVWLYEPDHDDSEVKAYPTTAARAPEHPLATPAHASAKAANSQ